MQKENHTVLFGVASHEQRVAIYALLKGYGMRMDFTHVETGLHEPIAFDPLLGRLAHLLQTKTQELRGTHGTMLSLTIPVHHGGHIYLEVGLQEKFGPWARFLPSEREPGNTLIPYFLITLLPDSMPRTLPAGRL